MRVLVMGASLNPNRYAYLAVNDLLDRNHEVLALGSRSGEYRGVKIETEPIEFKEIDTKKRIIFTEVGYRSMKGSTIKPWEHNTTNAYSAAIQDRAYQALFQVVWQEDWLAGMFIWKWYHNHESKGNKGNIDFTPQNKMAEATIREYWQN